MKKISLIVVAVVGLGMSSYGQWTMPGCGGKSYTITPSSLKKNSSNSSTRTANSRSVGTPNTRVTYSSTTISTTTSSTTYNNSSNTSYDVVNAAFDAVFDASVDDLFDWIFNGAERRREEQVQLLEWQRQYEAQMEEEKRIQQEQFQKDAANTFSTLKGMNDENNGLTFKTEAPLLEEQGVYPYVSPRLFEPQHAPEMISTIEQHVSIVNENMFLEETTNKLTDVFNISLILTEKATDLTTTVMKSPIYENALDWLSENTDNKYVKALKDNRESTIENFENISEGYKLGKAIYKEDTKKVESFVVDKFKGIATELSDNYFMCSPFKNFYTTIKNHGIIAGLYINRLTEFLGNFSNEAKKAINSNFNYQPVFIEKEAMETLKFTHKGIKISLK